MSRRSREAPPGFFQKGVDMGLVDLDLFKKHVRADDLSADDTVLSQYLEAATEFVIRLTNRTQEELLEMGGGKLPAPLVQAVLLIGAANYSTPENAQERQYTEVPYGATALIKSYRKLSEGGAG